LKDAEKDFMIKKTGVLTLLLIPFMLFAQKNEKSKVFTGGMMLHTSYLQNADAARNLFGMGYGLGGQMSFYVSNRFRLGMEGFTSTKNRNDDLGFYKISWGGFTGAYELGQNRLHIVPAITAGGGKVKDLFFLSVDDTDRLPDEVIYLVFSDFLVYPSLTLEYSLRSKLTLLLRSDFLFPVFSENRSDFAYGPRFYVGILFNR